MKSPFGGCHSRSGHVNSDVTMPTPLAAPPRLRGWRVFGAALGVAAVVYVASQADWATGRRLLLNIGALWPLVLLPFLVSMLCSTAAWQVTLYQLGFQVAFPPLLRMRIVAEGVVGAVPGGALVTETLKPFWLNRSFAVPMGAATASVVLTKAFVVQSEGAYLLLSVALAYSTWSATTHLLAGPVSWLWDALPLVGLMLVIGGTVLLYALQKGTAVRVLQWLLRRIPLPFLQRSLDRKQHFFDSTAGSFATFFGTAGITTCGMAFAFTLGQWLFEAAETFLILRLLGLHPSFTQALLVESLLSAVRAVMFFLPGGLGAQEVAAFFLLGIIGIPDPKGAVTAWAFTRRSKEVFWIVTALCLGFVKRR